MFSLSFRVYIYVLQVSGRVLFPGAAMFEAGRAGGAALADRTGADVAGADVEFDDAAGVPDLALTAAAIPAPLLLPKTLVPNPRLQKPCPFLDLQRFLPCTCPVQSTGMSDDHEKEYILRGYRGILWGSISYIRG